VEKNTKFPVNNTILQINFQNVIGMKS